MSASAKIFLSTVSDEFRAYRDQLRSDLTRPNVEVKVQEDFKDQRGGTLDELDVYIAGCDAVIHLVGDMTGSAPGEPALRALRAKYSDLADKLPPLGEALQSGLPFLIRNGKPGLRSIMANCCSSPKRPRPPNGAQTTRPRTPRAPPKRRISSASKPWIAIPAVPLPTRTISPSTYCLPPF
jgi:hypothetical protein